MRGSRDWLRRRRDEPLEPDAGNAAEGSEESGHAMSAWFLFYEAQFFIGC